MSHRYHPHPEDKQASQSGKNENDSNKQGEQAPTQKNEGRRTPESRHDRENQVGGTNQHRCAPAPPGKATRAARTAAPAERQARWTGASSRRTRNSAPIPAGSRTAASGRRPA
ncbi:hypothetical protein HK414_00290 [Ramlibacter terrae]|uniref:Uncharacterized protein n=1 Tax=Ramlibacter terrae TaxID=2732511 RepID=A0ABX6NZB4_9BURK|nr:hypothetical protein HK414_00290 [Ramlibacter terrae]